MATNLIPKKSTVSGKVPDASDLESGEVAINLTDAILYAKHTDGSIVNLSGAPELHTHTISQVSSLQAELDKKVDSVNGQGGDVNLWVVTDTETVNVTSGQTEVNLVDITLSTNKVMLFLESYCDSKYINEYTVTSNTQITLDYPIEAEGKLYVIHHSISYSDQNTYDAVQTHESLSDPHPQYIKEAPNDGGVYFRTGGTWLNSESYNLDLVTEREDISVVKGQNTITLTSLSLKSNPIIFVDGYIGKEQIVDFSITSSDTISLTNSVENDGTLTVIQYMSLQ